MKVITVLILASLATLSMAGRLRSQTAFDDSEALAKDDNDKELSQVDNAAVSGKVSTDAIAQNDALRAKSNAAAEARDQKRVSFHGRGGDAGSGGGGVVGGGKDFKRARAPGGGGFGGVARGGGKGFKRARAQRGAAGSGMGGGYGRRRQRLPFSAGYYIIQPAPPAFPHFPPPYQRSPHFPCASRGLCY